MAAAVAAERGARPRLVWMTTPVALMARRRAPRAPAASRASRAASISSGGGQRPAGQHRGPARLQLGPDRLHDRLVAEPPHQPGPLGRLQQPVGPGELAGLGGGAGGVGRAHVGSNSTAADSWTRRVGIPVAPTGKRGQKIVALACPSG